MYDIACGRICTFSGRVCGVFLTLFRDTLDARLRDKKDIFKDLEISDALARELRRTPEDDMTVKVRILPASR